MPPPDPAAATRGLTVLVLAGQRGGVPDPMAAAAGLSHKALLRIDGATMLSRVLRSVRAVPEAGRIVLSAHDPAALLREAGEADAADIVPVRQAASPSQSVAEALERFGAPMLVTTADHALLTPEMIGGLLRAAPASADVTAAVATRAVVLAAYPDTRRTWLRFRDESVSGCNLFLLRTRRAARLLRFWQRVEAARKRPLRIARLIGPTALVLYATRLGSLPGMLRLLGRRVGVRLATVALPFADAAIDVDTPADLALVRGIVRGRAGG